MAAYVRKGAELLEASRKGENPFVGYAPRHPEVVALPFAGEEFLSAEVVGTAAAAHCACVLVAGGLGERLGFSGIKVALPTELSTGTCFLELFAEHIKG